MKSKKRALRRHHKERLKKNLVKNSWFDHIESDESASRLVDNLATCSDPYCCGNERKRSNSKKHKSHQEQRFIDSADEQLKESNLVPEKEDISQIGRRDLEDVLRKLTQIYNVCNVIIAYRWNDENAHRYIVDILVSDKSANLCKANEEENRGGKYTCKIYKMRIDEVESFLKSKNLINYTGLA